MLDERLQARLDERLARFEELEAKLQDPSVGSDPRIGEYLREHGALAKSMQRYREYRDLVQQLGEYRATAADETEEPDYRALAAEELPKLEASIEELSKGLVDELVGASADDSKNVIVEVRPGTGGEEAALFAGDLFRMYRTYAEARGWKLEMMNAHPSDQGGLREVIFSVQGENVFRDLKHEGGGHRVQRVPQTESQGRIHTSAATVAVLPEAEAYEVELKPEELRIDTQASSGPGGQSVNTTNSSVRITHLPTGLVVFIQEEKSQHKNKAKALRVLRSRLYEMRQREEEAKRAAERRGQTGSGDRSERIRTYNFPQDRCTDHRLGRSFPLSEIIAGDMDKLIEALVEYGKQQDLAEA